MEFWIKAGQLLLSLSILIVLHEFGHYIPAKLFKIKVEKFYLFFDPWFSLFKKKIGETTWGIGWLPLGGYVKISGMIDESMDKEQMAKPPEKWEFRSKPAWQRFIVMIGGVTVNVILGFLIYIMVFATWGDNVLENDKLKYGLAIHPALKELDLGLEDGDIITAVDGEPVNNVNLINNQVFLRGYRKLEVQKPDGTTKTVKLPENVDDIMWEKDAMLSFSPRIPTVVDTVMPNRDIFDKGLQKGDSIVSLNGNPTPFFSDFQLEMQNLEGDSVLATIGFYRDGEKMEIAAHASKKEGRYTFGFGNTIPDFLEPTHIDYSFGEAIGKGFSKAGWTIHDYAAQLPLLFTSKGASSIGGFGTIGSLFPAQWDWQKFWYLTAFLSMVLAFMNILPIPALDGGHLMFLSYEMITGRKPHEKAMEYAQMIGMILLITLLLYANGMDLIRGIFGS